MARITRTDRTSIQIVVPKESKDRLEALADGRPISHLIREALKKVYGIDFSIEIDEAADGKRP